VAGVSPLEQPICGNCMHPLVQLLGVARSFGETIALHPTDLDFLPGLTTALIGPSGCGKSTLLRLIIRLVTPDTGKVIFDETEVTEANAQAVRRRIGYVIQEGGLFPHLTARANVLLMARHLGQTTPEMEKRLEELCALSQFPRAALDRFPAELSGGQRQRVSLMRALMLAPEVLLLDEPLGALDPLVRSALQRDLKEIFARLKQTAVLVTHDMGEAAYLAHDIVLMNDGRIVQRGSAAELRDHPANEFVSEFISAQRSAAF
jgi:osmoprotectant transport system ATP-binding protein